MPSVVDIVNMGLFAAGTQSTVTSINPSDGSAEGDVASVLYQPQVDALHRSAHWNFARRQEYMTLLKAAQGTPENPSGSLPIPLTPWLYEYAYPTDCLKARYILPFIPPNQTTPPLMTGLTPASPWWVPEASIPFIVGKDKDSNGNLINVILTNAQQAQLVFTGRIVDPNLWDPHFVIAATALLGAWFVNPLSRNRALLQDNVKICADVVQQARISDGNEGTPKFDHEPDWIRVRGTNGIWLGNGYPCWYGWDALALPGAII